MRYIRRGALALLLALVLMAPGAFAQQVRLPASGVPAFEFVPPPGWTSQIDSYDNLQLLLPDRMGVVQLSMATGDDAKAALEDFAAGILENAGAQPYGLSGPGVIAGRPGQSFQSSIVNQQGTKIDLLLVLARLDADHVAAQATIKAVGINAADSAAIDDLIARVRIVGAP